MAPLKTNYKNQTNKIVSNERNMHLRLLKLPYGFIGTVYWVGWGYGGQGLLWTPWGYFGQIWKNYQ